MIKLWENCRNAKQPIIVAFSGGNDSAACLAYLTTEFGLRCVCVMVDNGFIPDKVKERAIKFCDQLGIELCIKSFSLLDELPDSLCDPCHICIPKIVDLLAKVARHSRAIAIATGHLYGPAFEHHRVGSINLIRVAPLYIDTIDELGRKRILNRVGWENTISFGNSSNCALLGYVEFFYKKKWGYSPVLAELSHEVRAGTLSRASALAKLENPQSFLPEYEKIAELLHKKGKMKI